MRAHFLSLGLTVLTCLVARPARATICAFDCQPTECGFSFDEALHCGELPANHVLEMSVTCSDSIPADAFPRLFDDQGNEWPTSWEPVRTITEGRWDNPRTIYRRLGPDLAAGRRYSLGGVAPARCATLIEYRTCSQDVVLCSEDATVSDCCAVFGERGFSFEVQELPSNEVVTGRDGAPGFPAQAGEGGATNGGGGGATNGEGGATNGDTPTRWEDYLVFRATERDDTPPAPARVDVTCLLNSGFPVLGAPLYSFPEVPEDVVRLEVWGSLGEAPPEHLLSWFASPCRAGETREFFPLTHVPFRWDLTEIGRWRFFARATDSAGNMTDGPETELDFPEGCQETRWDSSAFVQECATSALPTVSDCGAPAPPLLPTLSCPVSDDPDDDFSDLGVFPDSVDGFAPLPGSDSSLRSQSDCSCSTPGTPTRSPLRLFGLGALALWSTRRRNLEKRARP